MSLISTTIPNLVNGVSQQPYAMRLASQCEEQINAHSSVVEGLRKRPGTRHLAKLPNIAGNIFIHTINRDAVEQYIVIIQNGNLRVFDLNGTEKTVTFPDGKTYLSSASPAEEFRCVTVADYTFVLNTKVSTKASATLTPSRPYEALAWVKQGAYGAKYTLTVDGKVATYTVPDGSQAAHVNSVTTDNIATQLAAGITSALGAGWSVVRYGSTMHIKRTDGAVFTISSDDSIGDNGLEVIAQKAQRFSNLPARAVAGFTVEIVGDQSSSFDNYFVSYDVTGTGTSSGVWKESLKGGESVGLDAATMPHVLIRNADGTFTFKRADWENRKVGDLDSNPLPSFVGRPLNDIFFHRNRLGFVSDENIVFSRAGEYFTFFRGTATSTLDTDPIDIGVSHVKVSILRHAVPFNETMLLFSDQTQFQLGNADVLTPNTISVNQTTEYECSLRAKPVGAGRYVYFAVNRGTYTGLREYFVDGETESEDAADVTGHVPKYIPGGVYKIAASSNEDCVVVLSDQQRNSAWVYKYYWSNGEKLQSSWSRWEFHPNDEILNCDFIESRLYFVIRRSDGLHLEVMNLEPGATEANWDISVHLDSMVTQARCTVTFLENDPALEADNVTQVTLPYKLRAGETVQLVTGPGGSRVPGFVVSEYTLDNAGTFSVLSFKGDWRGQPFYIGKPYTFRYRFSTLVIKEEAVGGGQLTVGEGRIQLRKMSVLYNNAGYFRAEVTPFRRETYRYTFSGRVVGSGRNVLGQVAIEEGKFSFPVMAKNDQVEIELINDSYLPCFFLSAEWEAFYVIRSRRL
ncbi:TPA: hypothetical protein ACQQIU_002744 [Pseudomonas aeruginosa]